MGAPSGIHLEYLPLLFLGVCGTIAQVMLLIAFIKDPLRCFRNSASYLVANLAVSDLIAVLYRPCVVYFSPHLEWKLEYFSSAVYVSVFTIFSIAVDRYLMVVHPFKHRYLVNGKKVAVWVTFLWLIGLTFPLKLSIFGKNTYDHPINNCFGLLIILSTGLTYAMTYFSLKNQARHLAEQDATFTVNCGQKTHVLKERQFLKTIIIISLVAVATLSPIIVLEEVIYVFSLKSFSDETSCKILKRIFSTIFHANFVVNPFIYIWRLPKYRRTFYSLYCRKTRS